MQLPNVTAKKCAHTKCVVKASSTLSIYVLIMHAMLMDGTTTCRSYLTKIKCMWLCVFGFEFLQGQRH
jgi:hypothetical protein